MCTPENRQLESRTVILLLSGGPVNGLCLAEVGCEWGGGKSESVVGLLTGKEAGMGKLGGGRREKCQRRGRGGVGGGRGREEGERGREEYTWREVE